MSEQLFFSKSSEIERYRGREKRDRESEGGWYRDFYCCFKISAYIRLFLKRGGMGRSRLFEWRTC
jgi:hypothetical protein